MILVVFGAVGAFWGSTVNKVGTCFLFLNRDREGFEQ